jgi:hypothetical protein
VAIDNLAWTPLSTPFGVDGLSVRSVSATEFLIRTTDTDPATEDTVAAGLQETITAGSGPETGKPVDGAVFAYAKSTVPSDTLVLTFIRQR